MLHLACLVDQWVWLSAALLRPGRPEQMPQAERPPQDRSVCAADMQTLLLTNRAALKEILVMAYRPLGLC